MVMNRPSRTAEWTALMRALGDLGITTVHGFTDPVTAKLLPVRLAIVYRVAQLLTASGATQVLRRRFGPIMDILTLRALAIDEAIAAAPDDPPATGIDQLIILGAGFDARAFRLPRLGRVDSAQNRTKSRRVRLLRSNEPLR